MACQKRAVIWSRGWSSAIVLGSPLPRNHAGIICSTYHAYNDSEASKKKPKAGASRNGERYVVMGSYHNRQWSLLLAVRHAVRTYSTVEDQGNGSDAQAEDDAVYSFTPGQPDGNDGSRRLPW